MRSYWFEPSQKCAMRALATLPPPLMTNVPWKFCRVAASWMLSSHARGSRTTPGAEAAVCDQLWLAATNSPHTRAKAEIRRDDMRTGVRRGRASAAFGGARIDRGSHVDRQSEGRAAGELLVRGEVGVEARVAQQTQVRIGRHERPGHLRCTARGRHR